MNEQVVLVHGLLVRGLVMARLAKRLRAADFEAHLFNYSTRSEPLPALAERLYQFVKSRELQTMHVLAHSMGGLVAMAMLARWSKSLPPGRVVLLGSPVNGSELARRLARGRAGRLFFGKSGVTLSGGCDDQSAAREVGIIAGTKPYGVGRFFRVFDEPGDGTVAVSETRMAGAAGHLELPVTHTGMLFSRAVADQAICFLKSGQFEAQNRRV